VTSSREIRDLLLSPEQAVTLNAHGTKEAAVLVPMHGWPDAPGLVFTERRHDLRRHPGEVSFPGGRQDPGEQLIETALREAQEEIGLARDAVEIVGALPPVGTFVTAYKVHPFVGLIEPGMRFEPNPDEVESVVIVSLEDLVAGYDRRLLFRQGIPFRTDTYKVDDTLIWGATARILGELLARLDGPGR